MTLTGTIFFVCLSQMFFLPVINLLGQTADSTVLTVNKTKDFEITGDGNSDNWNNEKWLSLPKRNENGIAYLTKIKILYSDSGIYCLYYWQDNKLTSTLREDFSDLFN